MIKLVEVCSSHNKYTNRDTSGRKFTLREIFVNPEHVVCIREDINSAQFLQEGQLPDGLDSRTRFSKLHLNRGQNGLDVVVIGDPDLIKEKLGLMQRTLLKG